MGKAKHNLNDKAKFPDMVSWFSVPVLIDAARRAILSALFGSYADRRLVHAALNLMDDTALSNHCDCREKVCGSSKDEVWIDYVADTGDGFESTYTIAYLLGSGFLSLGNGIENLQLPRGNVLVMGGDEVYPTPTREEYQRRFDRPYKLAFPEGSGAKAPLLFMLPGNHDWYDGLTLFLARYCSGKGASFGGWKLHQSRSYFATQILDNWWIFGVDTQLGEDIDIPQAEYFQRVVERMPEYSNIILCASVPTWLDAAWSKNEDDRDLRSKFERGIDYVATKIIKEKNPTARIPLVLSGDKHHYSRYFASKTETHFITSGGGGAFLHPTHLLEDKIEHVSWIKQDETLVLGHRKENQVSDAPIEACYPSRGTSRILTFGNLLFPLKNPQFCLVLGVVYSFIGLLLILFRSQPETHVLGVGNLWTPLAFVLLSCFFGIFYAYTDSRKKWIKGVGALLHGGAHYVALFILTCLVFSDAVEAQQLNSFSLIIPLLKMLVLGGVVAGVIWGIYLFCSLRFLKMHSNDGFSSMSIKDYKNFLRIKVTKDTLTVYPIGVDRPLSRDKWENNESDHGAGIVPKEAIELRLIENPIEVMLTRTHKEVG
ncbi:MAG: metallophosphoesterase [Alphaproteobacteria bacterium]|nr:metallophosphoesterase [Alphaproteobacteria bacterium]